MTSYRNYTREITDNKLKDLKTHYKLQLKNRGFLTPKKKRRLLKLGKKERGTSDADFWYRIKHQAKHSLFDLQLISEVADGSQLQEIFEPLTKEDYKDRNKGLFKRTDLRFLIETIFSSHKPEESNRGDWRFKLALDMLNISIGYFRNMPSFQSKLHNRMFEEVLDVLDENRDSTESGLS